jgi:two-component system, chemotaxis family, protein-glutamate methylesterase/glutaminase
MTRCLSYRLGKVAGKASIFLIRWLHSRKEFDTMPQQCIVIGASAGGFQVLVDIASQLPADLPVPVFMVIHLPADHPSELPSILSRAGPLRAIHPEDGRQIEPGFIYVAPPDHHLLIDNSRVAVKKGPKENGFRPSIDALFRSAAYSYGAGAIGVVLSGALHDGTSGLWSIKRLGGVAIVQDPFEAKYSSMPRSALEYVDADHKVPSTEIASLLSQLVRQPAVEPARIEDDVQDVQEPSGSIAKEIQIAAGLNLPEKSILDLGHLSPFTCPECRGALVRIKEGKFFRFRCHTGHGFSADALLKGLLETIDGLIWQVMRGSQEASMLLEHIGRHMQSVGEDVSAETFLEKARELSQQAGQFQKIAVGQEGLRGDGREQQPAD